MKTDSVPIFVLVGLLIFIYGLTVTGAIAQDHTAKAHDLEAESELVVVGQVASIQSRWSEDQSYIYSEVILSVEEFVKGDRPGNTVTVRVLGGEVDGVGEFYSHTARFLDGEDVLVYLKPDERGRLQVTGGDHGKYVLTDNNGPEDTRFFGDGFVVNRTLSGLPLHWANGEMEYHISESVPNRFRDPIRFGFNAWHLRSEITNLIHSEFKGLTSSTQWGGPVDGINNVVYIDRDWTTRTGASGDIIALTRIRYNAFTGRITDADIALNANHHRFSHNASPNTYDMHNTIAHEVGHVWGLSDLFLEGMPGYHEDMDHPDHVLDNEQQTMFGVFPLRETKKRTIDEGDIAGIKHVYEELPVLNIDVVLVYDGSGNYVDTYNALTQSKNSGVELVDKLRIGDRIGVVHLNDGEIVGLTEIDDIGTRITVQNKILDIVQGGNVTLGSGLQTAQGLFEQTDNVQAIILFSSGEEEAPPWAIDLLDALTVPVYTIGFDGSQGQTTLNMISDATGGAFFEVPDSTHIIHAVGEIWTQLINQLTLFADGGLIGAIPEDGLEYDVLVDEDVEIFEPGIRHQGLTETATIASPGRNNGSGPELEFCLIPPNGEDEICTDDPRYIRGLSYGFFKITNPVKGKWKLRIRNPEGLPNQQFFGYANATSRDLAMTAELDKRRYIIGDIINVSVTLMAGGHPVFTGHGQFGDPITDAEVAAEVTFPDGSVDAVTLHHQGNGLYNASVATDDMPGSYQFKVTAMKSDEFNRERRLSTYVATSEAEFAIHTALTILNHMIHYIDGLGDDAFKPAGDIRRIPLINKLEVVIEYILAEQYEDAIEKLETDIRPKVDGDWVVDPVAQAHLVAQVDLLIGILSDIVGFDGQMASTSDDRTIAQGDIPDRFDISQNYPNPFNPVTTIRYQLPEDVHVTIGVYNILGQRVRTLVNEEQAPGYYSVIWDGTNQSGMSVSSGMYLYRIQAGGYNEVRKMLFMK